MKGIWIAVVVMFVTVTIAQADNFTLKSADMGGQLSQNQVYSGFGCSGKNQSPQLSWDSAPTGTKSFAVTVYDPDAPTGSGWWHWIVTNIPAKVNELVTDAGNTQRQALPQGALQSVTDFGQPGYGGACPPEGDDAHRYIFTVYALKVDKLKVSPETPPAMVGFMVNQNSIAKASLVAYYERE